ncbi:hypothetical protein CFN78_13165 [Amycolatopsis antarctica]|uniref:Peptidase M64 n=2 Tax=Amycolatopsis antarctica TaxID=1854586 RepID=A0A263D423_9PSEU|nr:hypothetical protein CFN78_13165 [Amycolatopsis antarctica]
MTQVEVPVRPPSPGLPAAAVQAEVVPVQETGPSSERFDLVFVGDGYTEGDLPGYGDDVKAKWEELAAVEPFATYREYFNVWQVNVVSPQAGVDHDPSFGSSVDTALDMGFYCMGGSPDTQRLLCVDETKAGQFAGLAPEADQVIALGNTTTYGGAGGGTATAAGKNESAGQIAIHELGHSIGGLADEYDYPNDRYTGPEPDGPNVSIQTAEQMQQSGTKWAQYIGQESPDGGTVGSYEGAFYYKTGVYRPTENSIMRTLGQEFNSPSRDIMIEAFRAKVPGLPSR